MAVYLGNSEKLKVNLNGAAYVLHTYASANMIDGVVLLSSDDYTLRDFNGLYLTVKEGEN